MINLESIDLTQNKRFERIVNNEESQKRFENENNDRGIHRLKKGEIPHYSHSDSLITVSSNSNITITTNPSWTITVDDITNDWSTTNEINDIWLNTNITTTSLNTVSWSVSNTNIDDLITWSVPSLYPSTSYKLSNNFLTSFDNIANKDVNSRLQYDPFSENYSDSYGSIKHRISNEDDVSSDKYIKRDHIKNRLNSQSDYNRHMDDTRQLYNYFDRAPIIDRMIDDVEGGLTNLWYDINNKHNPEYALRKRAPFIERVYRTRRGASFDSIELKYDLTLAKEHFELSSQL